MVCQRKIATFSDPVILRIGHAPTSEIIGRFARSRQSPYLWLTPIDIPPEVARPFSVDMQAYRAEQDDIRCDGLAVGTSFG